MNFPYGFLKQILKISRTWLCIFAKNDLQHVQIE